jgi:hypothetical protein
VRAHLAEHRPPPDTGSLRGDLIAYITGQIEAMRKGTLDIQVPIAAAGDPELAGVVRELTVQRLDELDEMLARSEHRGELAQGADRRRVIEIVAGAAWARYMEQLPFDDDFAERVADMIITGIARR